MIAAAMKPTDAENRALCRRARNGRTKAERLKARNELLLRNQGLIFTEAKRYHTSCRFYFGDLVSEGQFGLLRAIDGYSLSSPISFTTYAVAMIRHAIRNYQQDNQSVIRVPRSHNGRQESSELIRDRERAISVGRLVYEVPRQDQVSVSEEEREEVRRTVHRMLDVLTERQRSVLSAYYGLEPAGGRTVAELVRHLGVSWGSVHKSRYAAEKTLRDTFACEGGAA